MSSPVALRDLCWLEIEGAHETKGRPCVVVRVEEEWVEVVYGQTKAGSGQRVAIEPDDPNFKRWGLQHPTYFRSGSVKVIRRSIVERAKRTGSCTHERFAEFQEIAEEWRRSAPA